MLKPSVKRCAGGAAAAHRISAEASSCYSEQRKSSTAGSTFAPVMGRRFVRVEAAFERSRQKTPGRVHI